ncbi:MAG: pseudouridine synthase [bacterium]|nr:pseudouridine synthase [bacterium]
MAQIRLQKYLADCGIASRRSAEELMRSGQISVNGQKAMNPGLKIDPEKDKVIFNNKIVVPSKEENIYILLNKPRGYITTVKDVHAEKTVFDLLKGINVKLFPVGRLDKDTTGLLLLTNDGEMCFKLTHPKFEINKVYYIKIKNDIKDIDIARLEAGIMVDGIKTSPAKVEVISRNSDISEIKLTITEGKKRQIRKMINNIGYYLVELKRIKFGPVNLGDLREGNFRYLVKSEIEKLKK